MKNQSALSDNLKSMFAAIVIPVSLAAAIIIYMFVFGNPANFQGGDPNNHPLPENYLGIVYKGGPIVPVLLSLLIIVVTFSLERFFTLKKASGSGRTDTFVRKVKSCLSESNAHNAFTACDNQKGSVANVVKSALKKYAEVESDQEMNKEQKILSIQKEVEEATALEIPMLQKNLVILSTVASIATLMGLLGTVLGMVKAFAALATAGAPDAIALANGISEALINTALGVATSAIAIVAYNYFNSKIDMISFKMDEVGFIITQTFASKYPNKLLVNS